MGREEANAFHSAWQAGVMSSPFQLAGMRSPDAVQPGQEPQTTSVILKVGICGYFFPDTYTYALIYLQLYTYI